MFHNTNKNFVQMQEGRKLNKNFTQIRTEAVYVVVQFYPWFNFFIFLCSFLCKYMIMNIKQKKIKIEPRGKLNYNIYIQFEFILLASHFCCVLKTVKREHFSRVDFPPG